MNLSRNAVVVIIGAVIAFVLQLVLAPYIAVFGAVPDFLMAYTIVIALVTKSESSVLAFVMGMLFNIFGGGPVGSMAFLLLIGAFVVAKLFNVLDNDTIFMPFALIAGSILAIQILYSLFLLGVGYEATLGQALLYRALPCSIYDIIIGFIMYLLVFRLFVPQEKVPGMAQLR